MSYSNEELGVADYFQQFHDALEFMDPVIQARQVAIMDPFRTLIPRTVFTLGEGMVRKINKFHPDVGDQDGLDTWTDVQISKVAEGADSGVNACGYNPHLISSGLETVQFSGLLTSRRTPHICIRDIRFTWEFKQQLAHYVNSLADITNSVWENYGREQYIKFAVDADAAYVLVGGSPLQQTLTYTPFTRDADGDTTITMPVTALNNVSKLKWAPLRYLSRYLENKAGVAALAMVNGRPQFGLILDLEDFDQMVSEDTQLREDYRNARPQVLIGQYGQVDSFKGYTLMHTLKQPRFRVKAQDGTTGTLKRVKPFIESTAGMKEGSRWIPNPDFFDAEFALGIIFLKNTFVIQVPPAGPNAPVGGMTFGATPSLNGEFKFINIPNEKTNLLGEVGFYFGRYEAFAKPLPNAEDAIVFLYRRCQAIEAEGCELPDNAEETDLVKIATTSSYAHVADSTTLAEITLVKPIAAEAGDNVTVVDDNAAEVAAIIAESVNAPTYVIAFASAAARKAEADMNDTAVAGLKVA